MLPFCIAMPIHFSAHICLAHDSDMTSSRLSRSPVPSDEIGRRRSPAPQLLIGSESSPGFDDTVNCLTNTLQDWRHSTVCGRGNPSSALADNGAKLATDVELGFVSRAQNAHIPNFFCYETRPQATQRRAIPHQRRHSNLTIINAAPPSSIRAAELKAGVLPCTGLMLGYPSPRHSKRMSLSAIFAMNY